MRVGDLEGPPAILKAKTTVHSAAERSLRHPGSQRPYKSRFKATCPGRLSDRGITASTSGLGIEAQTCQYSDISEDQAPVNRALQHSSTRMDGACGP